jgi:hypothetical protein
MEKLINVMNELVVHFPINKELVLANCEYDLYKEKNEHLRLQIEASKIN